MRVAQYFLGLLVALFIVVTVVPLPSQAASSAAIRAYDDVKANTKDYSGQSLIEAEFSNARLEGANFSNADLRGAVFNGANLRKANLHGANFGDGIAYLTNLAETDLSDAILSSAMLLQSNLRGAIVTNADFSGAILDREQQLSLCKTASGVNSVTGVDTRESLECS
jgi:uncharacterized protein YjbI with pentapeptide repeats